MATYHISGVPITDRDGRLVGILTNRDIRFVEPADYERPVSRVHDRRRAGHRSGRHDPGAGQAYFCRSIASKSCPWWTRSA